MSALWTLIVFLLLVGFVAVGIWLLIALFRNHHVPTWLKALLIVVVVFLPPVGLAACLVVWVATRSHSRDAGPPPAPARRQPFPPKPES